MITLKTADEELHAFSLETPEGQIDIQVVLGIDGTPCVYIDTPDWEDGPYGPRARIWLNDDTIYEGVPVPDPYQDQGPEA